MKEIILEFDKSVFFYFQSIQRPWLDYFLAWPTYLGHTLILLTILIAGLVVFDRKSCFQKMPALLTGYLLTYWMTTLAKAFFARPRPFLSWGNVNFLFDKPTNMSFPSGHTSLVFATAYLLNFLYPKKMRWTWAVAVWVAITRLYVGAHYPTDLIGGAVLGSFCGFLGTLIAPKAKKGAPV